MQRTQIYLSEKEKDILSYLSVNSKKNISELIREAIDRFYLHTKKIDFAESIQQVSGIWKYRNDIKNTKNYVRELRYDRRPLEKK